jgi:hypothetical protein
MLALMIKTNCLLPQALQGPVTAEKVIHDARLAVITFSFQLRDALLVERAAIT